MVLTIEFWIMPVLAALLSTLVFGLSLQYVRRNAVKRRTSEWSLRLQSLGFGLLIGGLTVLAQLVWTGELRFGLLAAYVSVKVVAKVLALSAVIIAAGIAVYWKVKRP